MINASPRILVCPDALKETADARVAAAAIAAGVGIAIADAEIRTIPLADGGEGTLDVLASSMPDIVLHRCSVPGPRPDRSAVEARFGVAPARRLAVVELAEAAGLARVAAADRDPERTGTDGVGRLLQAARDGLGDGPAEILLAVGGSATVDGGLGVVRALGVDIDVPGERPDRPLVGGDLGSVAGLRVPEEWRARWEGVRIRVLADVRNPLTGPQGAARIFGPQKSGSPEAVDRLERGLAHWGGLLRARFDVDPSRPGAGAAGGIGLALAAVFGASIESGFDVVASLVELDAAITSSDLVIVSEGRLDRQSVMGKVIGGVLDRAERHGVPVVAVPGAVEVDLPDVVRRRFAAIRTLEETVGRDAARTRVTDALRDATIDAVRRLRA
jgi:glycerate kinase